MKTNLAEVLSGPQRRGPTRRPANAEKQRWEAHITVRSKSERSVDEASLAWLGTLSETFFLAASTFRRQHLSPSFGGLLCSGIGEDQLDAWVVARLSDDPSYARGTISKILTHYSSFFGWAIANGYCEHNPVSVVKARHKLGRKPREPMEKKRAVLDFEQIRALVTADLRPIDRWLYTAAVLTGCRIGELMGLERRHWVRDPETIGLRGGELEALVVRQQWHTQLQKIMPCKDRTWRAIPIRPELLRLLHARDRWVRKVSGEIDPTAPLFPFLPQGKAPASWRRWNQRTALKRFKTIVLPEIGIDDGIRRDVHTLRHSFVSLMENSGVADRTIRQLTHPTSADDTRDAHLRYRHVYWSTLCEAVSSVDLGVRR